MGIINEELLRKYAPDKVDIVEFNTKVVGSTFRAKEGVDLDVVISSDFVLLDPEVGNPHDPFAVRVVHDKTGSHIGYLPKVNSIGVELAKEVWENSVKSGHLYLGRVTVTGGEDGKQKGFNLAIRQLIPKAGD